MADGPAAGVLRQTDVILSVNRKAVSSAVEAQRELQKVQSGHLAQLIVLRGGSETFVSGVSALVSGAFVSTGGWTSGDSFLHPWIRKKHISKKVRPKTEYTAILNRARLRSFCSSAWRSSSARRS